MKAKAPGTLSALKRRVKEFYKLLNRRDFEHCYERIDPRIRHRPTSVTLDQYTRSLDEFLDHVGLVRIVDLDIELHLREPSTLYEGRDFALGKTIWEDQTGHQHLLSERWVRDGKSWYTRSTGFVVPDLSTSQRRRRA
jgi:hypothetical protein